MIYRALADLVLVLHLAFIVFAVAGGLLALRWRWAPLVHLPAALWGVLVQVSSHVCPLTPLENALRSAAGDAGYRYVSMSLRHPIVAFSVDPPLLMAG